ncbi:hypothetical protein AALB39_05050 [Lachnospiraceae bacterium 54-53]
MDKRFTENKNQMRILASIGLTAILLLLLSAAGTMRNGKAARMSGEQAMEGAGSLASASDGQLAAKAAVTETSAEETSREISLTPEDKAFLDQLTALVSRGDLEGAARLLDGYEIPWEEFPCMYDQGVMKAEVGSGHGLVFTKASTFFYGDFEEGLPQGSCTALQVLELEEGRRYDYSMGTWDEGKMNGDGACGYNYYDGVTEEVTKVTEKKGVFQADRMEGEITYTSTNAAGSAATWQFSVSGGVIVPDERWIKDTDSSGAVIYKLMAADDGSHAYTLSESAMGENRWKNLIVYETFREEQ